MYPQSPFSFGQVVYKERFTNRTKEKKIIKDTLLGGNSLILISPRRMGKSSLIKQVFSEISKNKKIVLTTLDLMAYRSESHFLEAYASSILQANGNKVTHFIKKISTQLRYLTPTVSYGSGGMEKIGVSFNWAEQKKTKEEILNLPELLANQSGKRQIIALDEFQNIGKFNGAESLKSELRSYWQHQKHVSFCLVGSKRHMMEEIFTTTSAPFYNFGQIMKLQRIEEKHWVPFLVKRFEVAEKKISDSYAKKICDWTQCHSEYVQFLAHFIWTECATKVVKKNHMMAGIKKLLQATSIHFSEALDSLSNIQLNLLRAILNNEQQLTSKDIIKSYHLGTSAGVLKAKRALIKEDILEKTTSGYRLINPTFDLWFRIKIMNEQVLEQLEDSMKQ